MPSTATTRLRLEKMADGENDGTWGPKMTAVLDRIDEAIAGTTSVNTTGGDETLTSNNFTSDEARAAILLVTGTLASNCNIIIPAVSKTYVVDNQTSGSFSVTVKTSGGSGAVVAQGSTAQVMCDGTDCSLVGDADALKANTTDTLEVGYDSSTYNAGTQSGGTFTPDQENGNFQRAVNGGAHTLAPPSTSNGTSLIVQYTNNASAGAITTSGFTQVTGDSFTTTNGHDFMCYIVKCNSFSHLHVTALQ